MLLVQKLFVLVLLLHADDELPLERLVSESTHLPVAIFTTKHGSRKAYSGHPHCGQLRIVQANGRAGAESCHRHKYPSMRVEKINLRSSTSCSALLFRETELAHADGRATTGMKRCRQATPVRKVAMAVIDSASLL